MINYYVITVILKIKHLIKLLHNVQLFHKRTVKIKKSFRDLELIKAYLLDFNKKSIKDFLMINWKNTKEFILIEKDLFKQRILLKIKEINKNIILIV